MVSIVHDGSDMMVPVLSIDVGRKNLALCAVRPGATPADDIIVAWSVIACEPTPAGIASSLRALEVQHESWSRAMQECTDVVIERQPPRNATMSRLQHYLEMYFAMNDKTVVVQDAKHKLSYAASTPWWPPGDLESWTYYLRKKLSVQTTTAFLDATSQDPELTQAFAQSKKKDDFADSLLQCQAYCHMRRHGRVTDVVGSGDGGSGGGSGDSGGGSNGSGGSAQNLNARKRPNKTARKAPPRPPPKLAGAPAVFIV